MISVDLRTEDLYTDRWFYGVIVAGLPLSNDSVTSTDDGKFVIQKLNSVIKIY